jgi:glutamate-1-semialdehyde aminotransferase
MVTIGKSIGGGVPCGALGLTGDLVTQMFEQAEADYEDTGGVGGTLAGNPLSSAAMRATLEHVLTADAFERMIPLSSRFADGVQAAIDAHGMPWNVSRLGARAEYQFLPEPARDGTTANEAHDGVLERFLHLHALNRGVMITPFHNMALMSPATTAADVDAHSAVFDEALAELSA